MVLYERAAEIETKCEISGLYVIGMDRIHGGVRFHGRHFGIEVFEWPKRGVRDQLGVTQQKLVSNLLCSKP